MTAQELLNADPKLLPALLRQRQYLLRVGLVPAGCPSCSVSFNQVQGWGHTLETLPVEEIGMDPARGYKCPSCGTLCKVDVYFFGGGWGWSRL